MASNERPSRRPDALLTAGGILMVLCCAVAPAVIGAVAGSAIGGWLGIACAVLLAGVVGVVIHRRSKRRGGAC
jgi:hypothetical protein